MVTAGPALPPRSNRPTTRHLSGTPVSPPPAPGTPLQKRVNPIEEEQHPPPPPKGRTRERQRRKQKERRISRRTPLYRTMKNPGKNKRKTYQTSSTQRQDPTIHTERTHRSAGTGVKSTHAARTPKKQSSVWSFNSRPRFVLCRSRLGRAPQKCLQPLGDIGSRYVPRVIRGRLSRPPGSGPEELTVPVRVHVIGTTGPGQRAEKKRERVRGTLTRHSRAFNHPVLQQLYLS